MAANVYFGNTLFNKVNALLNMQVSFVEYRLIKCLNLAESLYIFKAISIEEFLFLFLKQSQKI